MFKAICCQKKLSYTLDWAASKEILADNNFYYTISMRGAILFLPWN